MELEQDPETGGLLPGEVPHSDHAEDAEHWIAVYEELTGFLVETDLDQDGTRERFRRRLEYWRRRRDALAGNRG